MDQLNYTVNMWFQTNVHFKVLKLLYKSLGDLNVSDKSYLCYYISLTCS